MSESEYVDYADENVDVVDPMYPKVDTTNYEMRMSEELRDQIDKYGHWMAVRKAIPGYRCPCVRSESEGPDANCRICHGDGKLYTDHVVRGRIYTPADGAEGHAPAGYVYTGGPMAIVEPGVVVPREADYILELVIDLETNEPLRPYQVRSVIKIINVREMRDIHGKIAFFQIKGETEIWEHAE